MSLASEPSGSHKVETLLTQHEIRITLNADNKIDAFKLAVMYNNHFKVHSYIWAYEIAQNTNYHLHGMITYINDKAPATSSRSEWMAKQTIKKQGPSTSHHSVVKDEFKYGAYCLKDGEYITNLNKEKIDDFLDRVAFIKEDKKKSAVSKLLDKIKPALDAIKAYNDTIPDDEFLPDAQEEFSEDITGKKYKKSMKCQEIELNKHPKMNKLIPSKKKIIITLSDIGQRILDVYHNEWDKDIQWSKLKQYTIYIADKCGLCGEEIKNNIEKLF